MLDNELVIRARDGDEAAFAILMDTMVGAYQRTAFNILRDRELAADATQQALLQMWRKLPRLRDPGRFSPWSYRLLVHACYAEARHSRRSLPDMPPSSADSVSGYGELHSIEDRDQLERGFQRLSIEQRTVVVLRFYLDLTIGDVASVLDIPVGTVKSRLHHAVQALRAALEADDRPTHMATAAQEVPR